METQDFPKTLEQIDSHLRDHDRGRVHAGGGHARRAEQDLHPQGAVSGKPDGGTAMETQVPPQAICNYTETRCDACACGACARGKTAESKLRANTRDALLLLEVLARRINERQPAVPANWGHVGSAADIRERLLQVAMSFALGPDGEEAAARRRLEEALCAGNDFVSAKLTNAM